MCWILLHFKYISLGLIFLILLISYISYISISLYLKVI